MGLRWQNGVLCLLVEQSTPAHTDMFVIPSLMEAEISIVKNFIFLEFLRGYENLECLLANYSKVDLLLAQHSMQSEFHVLHPAILRLIALITPLYRQLVVNPDVGHKVGHTITWLHRA